MNPMSYGGTPILISFINICYILHHEWIKKWLHKKLQQRRRDSRRWSEMLSVWPDLSKVRNLSLISIVLAISWVTILYLAKLWTYFAKYFIVLSNFSLFYMAKSWKNNITIWSHWMLVNLKPSHGAVYYDCQRSAASSLAKD